MKNLKILFAALALTSLSSCGTQIPASDGYTFDKQDFYRDDIHVKIVQFDNRKEFEAEAARVGIENTSVVMAFTTVSLSEPVCTIRVMNIPNDYEPKWIGHELIHCMYGNFHD